MLPLPRASSRGSASPSTARNIMACSLRITARTAWFRRHLARTSKRSAQTISLPAVGEFAGPNVRAARRSARLGARRSRTCSFSLPFVREHDDQACRFFDAHRGVVDQHRILGADKWRNFSFAVALVAFDHFIEHFGHRHLLALFLMFFPAALRALLRRGVEKNLQFRVRE